MAACYTRQKDYAKAIEMYEKSLCESNTRQTRAALADVKRMKEKADREAYIDPQKAEEHRQKGNEFFKNNDFPSAKKGELATRNTRKEINKQYYERGKRKIHNLHIEENPEIYMNCS